jgi:hypothetical protein
MKKGIIALSAALLFAAGCGSSDEPFTTIDATEDAQEILPAQKEDPSETPPVASAEDVILPESEVAPVEEFSPPVPLTEKSEDSDQDCVAPGDCVKIGTPPVASLTVAKTNSTGQNAHPNGGIIVTFSAPVDAATVTTDTLVLTPYRQVTKVAKYVGMDHTYLFSVETREENTPYTAVVKKGVKDEAGIALEEDFTWHFQTGDFSRPQVTSVLAMNPSTVWVVFSERVDMVSCIETGCIQVNNLGTILPVTVPGTLSLAEGGQGKIVAFNSDQPMAFEHDASVYGSGAYTVTVWGEDQEPARAVHDASGNGLTTTFKKNLADAVFKLRFFH